MSAGRVALPTRRTPAPPRFQLGNPSVQSVADARLHEKYAAAVVVRIGLRPGNNTDILEALGLIPTVRKTDHGLVSA